MLNTADCLFHHGQLFSVLPSSFLNNSFMTTTLGGGDDGGSGSEYNRRDGVLYSVSRTSQRVSSVCFNQHQDYQDLAAPH